MESLINMQCLSFYGDALHNPVVSSQNPSLSRSFGGGALKRGEEGEP